MKFLFFVIIFFSPLVTRADEPRHNHTFASSNGKFELSYKSDSPRDLQQKWELKQTWELIEKSSGKAVYELEGDDLSSMTVLVSDDGDNVVAIDDYSEREATPKLDVLLFYDKGKLISKYSLGEINGAAALEHSVSHFSWIWFDKDLSIKDSKINLKTFRLINYTFDVKTGNILKKESNPVLADNALYVYGKITRYLGNDKYEMDVCTLVQGDVPKTGKIRFEAKTHEFHGEYATVIIRDGQLVEAATPYILNSCNYARERSSKILKPVKK
jgi:hypothetical protein